MENKSEQMMNHVCLSTTWSHIDSLNMLDDDIHNNLLFTVIRPLAQHDQPID